MPFEKSHLRHAAFAGVAHDPSDGIGSPATVQLTGTSEWFIGMLFAGILTMAAFA